MKQHTITVLNDLNKKFYREVASSFSSTRKYPWQSWEKFWRLSQCFSKDNVRVGDVGCGNGRFGSWLQARASMSYFGIDSDLQLLKEAQFEIPDGIFAQCDVVQALLHGEVLIPHPLECIATFGIYHHIPSRRLRTQLMQSLAQNLVAGGEVWLTAWEPHQPSLPRDVTCTQFGIDPTELEAGDGFLGWKDSSAIRFVHSVQPGEVQQICADTTLKLESSWVEHGVGERGNHCFLLRKQ